MKQAIRISIIPCLLLAGFTGLFGSGIANADESHPGIGLESQYSEAVLAFDRQQIDKAVGILNQILAEHPDYTQALELKALALRTEGKDRLAIDEYLKLIKIKPEKERGPYYFEIGVLCYRNKNNKIARQYLERAISLNTNVAAAHLFLGMMSFGSDQTQEAESHFVEVDRLGLPEMKVVARYYLGLIYLKGGSPAHGTREFAQAKELALTLPDSKMASDTLAGLDKVLAPFNKGQFFGSATLQIEYDSNISETPSSAAVQTQASNTSTVEAVFNGGVGYMSPAMDPIQWVGSYQLSYNYNFNSAVKEFEYLSNIGSIYLNYHVLSDISGGIKLQGNYTFQNQPNDPTNLNGSYTQTRYSLSGELGPYFYAQIAQHYRLQTELYVRPQDFYTDPDLSGTDYVLRFTIQRETPDLYLNPGLSLTLEDNSAAGGDFKYRGYTVSLFDTLRPTSKDLINGGLDLISYDYYTNSQGRSDFTISPHISLLHNLGAKWALTGQLSYTTNSSTVPTSYSYNRFVIGAGISRAL